MNATPQFQTWAQGFAGCDGGNLNGSIWFCGIEWGTGKDHHLQTEMLTDVSQPRQLYQSGEDVLRDRVSGRRYQLNERLLKLIAAINGQPIAEYKSLASENPFPFHRNSDYFKMNLFPIAYRSLNDRTWSEDYAVATGIATLAGYLDWCKHHRFPRIRSWMERSNPRLIICYGMLSKVDFHDAFGGSEPWQTEQISALPLLWKLTNAGKTRLAIIPFLRPGRGVLSSAEQLQAFGQRLAALRAESFS